MKSKFKLWISRFNHYQQNEQLYFCVRHTSNHWTQLKPQNIPMAT